MRYEYNPAGDLTAVISPDGSRSTTDYDTWGKVVSTTQGGLTLRMEYDLAGQLHHHHLNIPTLDREFRWNENGQLIGIHGQSQERAYQYDGAGRLHRTQISSAQQDLSLLTLTDPAGTGWRSGRASRRCRRSGRLTASVKIRTVFTIRRNRRHRLAGRIR